MPILVYILMFGSLVAHGSSTSKCFWQNIMGTNSREMSHTIHRIPSENPSPNPDVLSAKTGVEEKPTDTGGGVLHAGGYLYVVLVALW